RLRSDSLFADPFPARFATAVLAAVKPAQGLAPAHQLPPLRRREENRFFTLNRIGPHVRHVKRVGRQVAGGVSLRLPHGFLEISELAQELLALFQKSLFEMFEILLGKQPLTLLCGPARSRPGPALRQRSTLQMGRFPSFGGRPPLPALLP